MSIEIDVLNGDASWPVAKPLIDAVWPETSSRNCHGVTSNGPMPICAC